MLITDVFDSMTASKAWYDKNILDLSGVAIYPFVSRAKASNGATLGRLKKTRIMVPAIIDATGRKVVDWESMSPYGRALRVRAERMLAPITGEQS